MSTDGRFSDVHRGFDDPDVGLMLCPLGRRVRPALQQPPDQLGPEEIRSWQLFLLNEKRVKLLTYIQAVCALRFFCQNTLHRRIEIDRIPLPRYEKKLPVILSKTEVKALLEAPKTQTPGHTRNDVRRRAPRIGSGQPQGI